MKKLMVAFAVVAVAFCAQAVSVNWQLEGGVQINGDWDLVEGDNAPAGWAIYLFDNSVVSRDSMLTALTANDSLDQFTALTYADLTSTDTDGAVGARATTLAVDAGNNVNAYVVLIDAAAAAEGKHAFVSDVYAAASTDPVPTTLRLADVDNGWINGLDHDIAGQAGSNWYTLQSVPEPTSGLLLLIGVAGLALRRRRA